MFGLYRQYDNSFEFYLTRYKIFGFDMSFILSVAENPKIRKDFEYAEGFIFYV